MSGTIAIVVLIAVMCIASFPDKKKESKTKDTENNNSKKNEDKFTVVNREEKDNSKAGEN